MEPLAKDLLTFYGPLAIGWIVAAFLWWRVMSDNKPGDTLKAYQCIIEDYHAAIVENTRVTERLAILLEERTRSQNSNRRSP